MVDRTDIERILHPHWPGPRLGDRLGGGNRNTVHSARWGTEQAVVRVGQRPATALGWELHLLIRLARLDFIVPTPILTKDGRLSDGGVCVFTWVDGDPPERHSDWLAVAHTLHRVHQAGASWTQRPGFAGTRELLVVDSGGDVDLREMPPDAAVACRAAWAGIAAEPRSVVHGDPGPSNIRVSGNGVGLIDWDEARVDASVLDFAEHPLAANLIQPPGRRAATGRAATAWEAANGWRIEPEYARRKLGELIALGEP